MGEEIAALVDELEAVLRRAGWWSDTPPPDEAFRSEVAFFGDTMAFSQWLQWVLVPRVEACLRGESDLPPDSQVAAYAARELDGVPEGSEVIDVLARFDDAVRARAGG